QYFLVSVRHERLNALLNAVDMACMLRPPSTRSAMTAPVKFPEYILSGLPVVVTPNIGDYSAMVEREELGLLADNLDDPVAVARRILHYLETHADDDHRYKIAWFGRKYLSKNRQIDQLIECYRRL
ncbi:MAG: glycosyltransferase, partial [bacterium]|nr:glycosyltransferase [bacterium]